MAAAEVPSAVSFDISSGFRGASILETLAHLRSAGTDQLPKQYILREEERSTIRHDEYQHLTLEIPVIDLSLVKTDRAAVVKQIHEAVTEWGFFHIVNHEIPVELLQEALAQGLQFFALPPEIKRRATPQPGGYLIGYTGDSSTTNWSALHWAELLFFTSLFLDTIVNQVWPDGNEAFRDTITKYISAADKVAKQLLELIAESLGLPTDIFAKHFGKNESSFRFNFYPACPTPTETMGALSHSDPNCLTLLLQDNVGGLQIEKDGQWLPVRPMEGSLVVNIGDMLEAWTNGICKSVLHRGVVNKEVNRLSIAAFMIVDHNLPISAPEELIDATHPRQYRTFTVMEAIHKYPIRIEKKLHGAAFLEECFKLEK